MYLGIGPDVEMNQLPVYSNCDDTRLSFKHTDTASLSAQAKNALTFRLLLTIGCLVQF